MYEKEQKILDEIKLLKMIVLDDKLFRRLNEKEGKISLQKSEILRGLSNLGFIILGAFLGFLMFFRHWVIIIGILDMLLLGEIIKLFRYNQQKNKFSEDFQEARNIRKSSQLIIGSSFGGQNE